MFRRFTSAAADQPDLRRRRRTQKQEFRRACAFEALERRWLLNADLAPVQTVEPLADEPVPTEEITLACCDSDSGTADSDNSCGDCIVAYIWDIDDGSATVPVVGVSESSATSQLTAEEIPILNYILASTDDFENSPNDPPSEEIMLSPLDTVDERPIIVDILGSTEDFQTSAGGDAPVGVGGNVDQFSEVDDLLWDDEDWLEYLI